MRLFILLAILVMATAVSAQESITDLEFILPSVSEDVTARLLPSIVKVQEPGGPCQNGLYLMTHVGDRDSILEKENQGLIENPLINRSWRHCSVFSTTSNDTVLMGRNWDNENVGSIIVNLLLPDHGYSSVTFSRAIDLGYPLHIDLEEIASGDFGARLSSSPLFAYDGMNEHGLAIGVAGSRSTTVEAQEGKLLVFIPLLIHKILNRAKTTAEAVDFVEGYIPFDLDKNSLNSHLLVVDASGRSAILEYTESHWHVIYGDKSWQVMSTKPVFNVPDSVMRENCWRFKHMSESLEQAPENRDWNSVLRILEDVSQRGTTWSVVYSPATKELYFSVYQQWETIYHLTLPKKK